MAKGDYSNSITISSSSMGCSTGYADCTTYTDGRAWRADVQPFVPWGVPQPPPEVKVIKKEIPKIIEGVDIMTLYDVYLVYAEDRKSPTVIPVYGVIARDEEDAKIKSGLMKSVLSEWDADYLTFIVKEIGYVKVKEKPKEVKTVK